jgi:hypothetical protein
MFDMPHKVAKISANYVQRSIPPLNVGMFVQTPLKISMFPLSNWVNYQIKPSPCGFLNSHNPWLTLMSSGAQVRWINPNTKMKRRMGSYFKLNAFQSNG